MVIGELSIVAEFSNSSMKDTSKESGGANIKVISVTNKMGGAVKDRAYPDTAVFQYASIEFWSVRTFQSTSFYIQDGTLSEIESRDLNRLATTSPSTLAPSSQAQNVVMPLEDVIIKRSGALHHSLTDLSPGDEISLWWYADGSGYAVRFANISMTISIVYTYDGADLYDPSTVLVSPNYVLADGAHSVIARIQGANTGSCWHKIQWVHPDGTIADDAWEQCDVGTTQSLAFTIPLAWQQYITGVTATAKCYIQTYWNNTYIGQTTTDFTIRTPNAAIPVLEQNQCQVTIDNSSAGTVVSGWGICVQGYSGAKLIVRTEKVQNGVEIASCIFKGIGLNQAVDTPDTLEDTDENEGVIQFSYSISKATLATMIANSNTSNGVTTVTFNAYIRDTRKANSELVTFSLSAYKYSTPSLTNISVFRCDSNGNSTEDGTSCSLTFSATVSNLGTVTDTEGVTTIRNAFTSRWRLYSVQTGSDGTVTRTHISGIKYTRNTSHTLTVTNYIESNWAGQIEVAKSYEVDLIVEDALSQRTLITRPIAADSYVLFFARGGNGIGIGCKTSKSEAALEINQDWNIYHGQYVVPAIRVLAKTDSLPTDGVSNLLILKRIS